MYKYITHLYGSTLEQIWHYNIVLRADSLYDLINKDVIRLLLCLHKGLKYQTKFWTQVGYCNFFILISSNMWNDFSHLVFQMEIILFKVKLCNQFIIHYTAQIFLKVLKWIFLNKSFWSFKKFYNVAPWWNHVFVYGNEF